MISLVVIARIRFFRDGLAELFDGSGFRVVATAGSGAAGLACVREHAPDIAVLALGPDAGAPLVGRLLDAAPGTRVVMLGIEDDDPEVLPLAEAGVAGYVTIEASADEVVRAVESVARGETLCSPRIAATLLGRVAALASDRREPRPVSALTARERQIVALIEEGRSNKEIARDLCIEVTTVKNHVHHILAKLHVARRGEAAAVLRRSYL